MKRAILLFAFVSSLIALVWFAVGCKSPHLETGGLYAPTNAAGQVVYNDLGLALADGSYKLAYETVSAIFKFERDNRAAIWALSPQVKKTLDKARTEAVDIDRRWAEARKLYKAKPTPAGLSAIQGVLLEIQRLIPVAQAQLDPVYSSITKTPAPVKPK